MEGGTSRIGKTSGGSWLGFRMRAPAGAMQTGKANTGRSMRRAEGGAGGLVQDVDGTHQGHR